MGASLQVELIPRTPTIAQSCTIGQLRSWISLKVSRYLMFPFLYENVLLLLLEIINNFVINAVFIVHFICIDMRGNFIIRRHKKLFKRVKLEKLFFLVVQSVVFLVFK